MKLFRKTCQIIILFCMIFPNISVAEKDSTKDKDIKIEIISDRMSSDQKSNEIVFSGKVVAKRGKLIIFSDKMTVYNNKADKNSKNKGRIEKIVATGHVKMEKDGRVATGDKAVYFEDEGKIVLTGNPRVIEKDNEITGTKMIFLLDEDKFEVEGSKEKRMKLTFFPEKKKSKEKK